MTPEYREQLINDFLSQNCIPLMSTKGKDYAQDNDVLANFKIVADLMGVTPRVCLGVYFSKGMEAIYKSMRGGSPESEPIESRIADAVNYLLIYYCLLQEEKGGRISEARRCGGEPK